jgi:hypothetical protein
MPALRKACAGALRSVGFGGVVIAGVLGVLVGGAGGCKAKASQAQCEELVDRYAELVVREKGDASADQAQTNLARQRERDEARGDDVFKNCRSEVSRDEYQCGMHAATAEQLVKCLE